MLAYLRSLLHSEKVFFQIFVEYLTVCQVFEKSLEVEVEGKKQKFVKYAAKELLPIHSPLHEPNDQIKTDRKNVCQHHSSENHITLPQTFVVLLSLEKDHLDEGIWSKYQRQIKDYVDDKIDQFCFSHFVIALKDVENLEAIIQ